MKTKFVLTALAATSMVLGLAENAHASYHGSASCQHHGLVTDVAMAERVGSEGLGFDGLRLHVNKAKTDIMYKEKDGSIDYGNPEGGQTALFDDGQGHQVKFTVLKKKLIYDHSTQGACSIEDDVKSEATMKMEIISATGTASGTLTFSCERQGFNAQMDISCRDKE